MISRKGVASASPTKMCESNSLKSISRKQEMCQFGKMGASLRSARKQWRSRRDERNLDFKSHLKSYIVAKWKTQCHSIITGTSPAASRW